jgi:hypothetical protein
MSTWEERMAQRARERRRARGEYRWDDPEDRPVLEAQAALEREQYWQQYREEHPEQATPVPPDDGTCRECAEWRENWPGVYMWFTTCGDGCTHGHHEDDIALAAS